MAPLSSPALTYSPHILPLVTLEPGCPRNLTCSVPRACERGTPPIFSRMSAALTSLGPRTTLSSVLTLTPRPQNHGTNLTCQVTFPGADVTVERTIQLNVTSGNPGRKSPSGVIVGAIGGAGVTGLLSSPICLVFFMVKKAHRKKAARTTASMNPMHPASESVSQVHSHAEDPTLGTKQEVHYASLSFHRSSPRKETSP